MRKLVLIMSIMAISGGIMLLGLNFASANGEDKKDTITNNISRKDIKNEVDNKVTGVIDNNKSMKLDQTSQTKSNNMYKENKISDIENDLNDILNKDKYTYDWEDKLDHKYGDDWDDLLEKIYGDDWEDKFEIKLKKIYGDKYKEDYDDAHDHDKDDEND